MVNPAIPLKATNAHDARKEARERWPHNDVQITGFRDKTAVYLTLVRNVTKGNVATATKGIRANRFVAKPV